MSDGPENCWNCGDGFGQGDRVAVVAEGQVVGEDHEWQAAPDTDGRRYVCRDCLFGDGDPPAADDGMETVPGTGGFVVTEPDDPTHTADVTSAEVNAGDDIHIELTLEAIVDESATHVSFPQGIRFEGLDGAQPAIVELAEDDAGDDAEFDEYLDHHTTTPTSGGQRTENVSAGTRSSYEDDTDGDPWNNAMTVGLVDTVAAARARAQQERAFVGQSGGVPDMTAESFLLDDLTVSIETSSLDELTEAHAAAAKEARRFSGSLVLGGDDGD